MRKFIMLLGVLPLVAAAADWGVLPPAPLPEIRAAGPAHSSKTFIAEARIENGRAELALPLDTPDSAVLVVFDEQPLSARLKGGPELRKRGFREEALAGMDVPAVGTRIEVAGLERGRHRLELLTHKREGVLRYAVAQPDSPLALGLRLRPLAVHGGEPVTLSAELAGAKIGTAELEARVRGVGRVALRDDGRGEDQAAGDGIYTGRFIAPRSDTLTQLRLRVDARGELAGGTPFHRTAGAGVMLSPQRATITALRSAPDGLQLELTGAPGRYRVQAIFGGAGRSLAWAQEDLLLEADPAGVGYLREGKDAGVRHLKFAAGGTGSATLSLPRPPVAASADAVIIRLLNRDSLALETERRLAIQPLARGGESLPLPKRAPPLPAGKAAAAERYGLQEAAGH